MRRIAAALVLAVVFLSGCHNTSYVTRAAPGQIHSETAHYFLFGLIGSNVYDVRKVCPQGVTAIHSRHSFVDMFLGSLTAGIWSPTTVTIVCAAGGADAGLPARVVLALDAEDRVIAAAVEDALGRVEMRTLRDVVEVSR